MNNATRDAIQTEKKIMYLALVEELSSCWTVNTTVTLQYTACLFLSCVTEILLLHFNTLHVFSCLVSLKCYCCPKRPIWSKPSNIQAGGVDPAEIFGGANLNHAHT